MIKPFKCFEMMSSIYLLSHHFEALRQFSFDFKSSNQDFQSIHSVLSSLISLLNLSSPKIQVPSKKNILRFHFKFKYHLEFRIF